MVRGNPRVSGGVPLPLPAKTPTPGEGYGFLELRVKGFRGSEGLKTPGVIGVYPSYLSYISYILFIYNFSTVYRSSLKLCRRIS